MLKIVNAKVFFKGAFIDGGIEFEKQIRRVGAEVTSENSEKDSWDAEGSYVIPGLIDIHTHGAVCEDASDGNAEGLAKMSRYYAKDGVTSFCPTTATAPEEDLIQAMHTIRDFERPENGAKIAGIHMEGPYLSPGRSGAMNPGALRNPDTAEFFRLNEASGGLVRLISVAPELPGAMEFIREVSKLVTVSVAHTNADYDLCMEAFANGASHITHTFNCMPGIHHREPGTVPAALDSGVTAELITDGFHIHPAVIRLAAKLFGEKLCLISDSLRCAGMPDGEYSLAGMEFVMKNGKATLKGRDTIAGSSIHLMEGMRRAVRFGVPLADAVKAASETPAKVIGQGSRIGSLEPGKDADLVILGSDLSVKAVFINGEKQNGAGT